MLSRTKRSAAALKGWAQHKRKPRGPNVKTRLDAISYTIDRLAERFDEIPRVDLSMYSRMDDRISTLETRVSNLIDYINRNRV